MRVRASLELVVPPFGHRAAARFSGITDPCLAVQVHAVVGGTPAYRREFARDDVPRGPEDFDDWVVRAVLDPASPLFREARYLLAEEPGVRDPSLYHSVLAAVAEGNTTRGGIADYVGRKATDIAHPLTVLTDNGLLRYEADVFRSNRATRPRGGRSSVNGEINRRLRWKDIPEGGKPSVDPGSVTRLSDAGLTPSGSGPRR